MKRDLTDLQIFTRAVRLGSLAAAGRELGYSNAVVSKRMQRLEESLKVRLLNRSTRKLSLTAEGAVYFEHCCAILAELQEVESQIAGGDGMPHGTLRVSVPAAFGRLHIAPLVPEFLRRYPAVNLSLHLSDQRVDLIEDGFDLAIRIGELTDSSMVARYLGQDNRQVVATPEYIRQHGCPTCPDDLLHHNALLFTGSSRLDHWRFVDKQGREQWVKVHGNFDTNNCDALREAILAGLGIALRPKWDVWRDIQTGAMQVLLPDYQQPSYPIHAIYPSRKQLSLRVRAFIDMLCERFGAVPYWENTAAQLSNVAQSDRTGRLSR